MKGVVTAGFVVVALGTVLVCSNTPEGVAARHWETFLNELTKHENRHAELAIDAAHRLDLYLDRLLLPGCRSVVAVGLPVATLNADFMRVPAVVLASLHREYLRTLYTVMPLRCSVRR